MIVKVQSRIKEINETLKAQSEEEFSVKVSDLKEMLLEAAQGGLKEKVDAQNNKIPNNIAGAVSAISELNRMDGNHAPVQSEVFSGETSPWGEVKASVDELDK